MEVLVWLVLLLMNSVLAFRPSPTHVLRPHNKQLRASRCGESPCLRRVRERTERKPAL